MAQKTREQMRKRRHARVRKKVSGTQACPRLCVYRSLNQMYAQLIDDRAGSTLASASTVEKDLQERLKGMNKSQQATLIGELIAERAIAGGVEQVVFDRGGYRYHGRVKSLADAARKAGLKF